jgi:hypothetical protein
MSSGRIVALRAATYCNPGSDAETSNRLTDRASRANQCQDNAMQARHPRFSTSVICKEAGGGKCMILGHCRKIKERTLTESVMASAHRARHEARLNGPRIRVINLSFAYASQDRPPRYRICSREA